MTDQRVIKARFPGWCPRCDKKIEFGDLIRQVKFTHEIVDVYGDGDEKCVEVTDDRWAHSDCARGVEKITRITDRTPGSDRMTAYCEPKVGKTLIPPSVADYQRTVYEALLDLKRLETSAAERGETLYQGFVQQFQRVPMPVTQPWTHGLSMMQQSVLLTAVRGPDGLPKYHPSKFLLRWYRRCILLSAMDGRVLSDPCEPNGGSFTGPSVSWDPGSREGDGPAHPGGFIASGGLRNGDYHAPENAYPRATWTEALDDWVTAYIAGLDEVPHHYQLHFLHAAEIVGYKHPDTGLIREWWRATYQRLCRDMHLRPEFEDDLDARLGDNREQWLAYGDEATEA